MKNAITKIALTPGHNPLSQGAKRGSMTEFRFAREFIPELMQRAKGIQGIELKAFERRYFGRYNYGKEMRQLHKQIDDWGAHIDIEMHYNAASSASAKGHEVLHYKNSTGGKIVAIAMDRAFDKHLFNRDRNRKPVGHGERGSYGLSVGKSKSILTEPFFKKELPDFLEGGKYREALFDAYIEFFRQIVALDGNTQALSPKKRPVTHQANTVLTQAELDFARELLA